MRQGGWPKTGYGARLRALREAAGVTQAGLAERAGCALNTVAKLEQGRQEPAWPLALAIADALGVAIGEFRVADGIAARKRGRPRKKPAT